MSIQERVRALAIAQDFGAEALELNRRLVEENPADLASRTRLARCLVAAGRLEEAESEYRFVLGREPRNRIAEGGLETIAHMRRPAYEPVTSRPARLERPSRTGSVAGPRAPRERSTRAADASGALKDPAPPYFSGFDPGAFVELSLCPRGDIRARFGPRVLDLVRRVNALPSCQEIAAAREAGRRQLFRVGRGEVQVDAGHWHVSSQGGGSEPQFDIGMYGGPHAGGDWVRVGLAFALGLEPSGDAGGAADGATVRTRFRRFQELLGSSRRSLFLGWMIKERGLVQVGRPGPRLDLQEATAAADLLEHADGDRPAWIFLGRWLAPADPADAAVLADPVTLVRTIDRVFLGLTPLWRAVME